MRFKTSDKVRCIESHQNAYFEEIIKNHIYTVKWATETHNHIVLQERILSYPSHLFEPAYIKNFSDKLKDLTE